MDSKRGISAIVATVLIILITIAGVTILWVAIIPMISQQSTFVDANARLDVVTSGGYTVYDKVNRIAIVQVKRGSDTSDMKYVRITLNFAGTSYSAVVDAPAANQMRSYKFNLSVGNYADPESVQVSPIFVTGTKEREGVTTSKAEIPTGTLGVIPPANELLNLTGDYRGTSNRCATVADCIPGQCQQTPVCNVDGSCSYTNKAVGTTCDDGNTATNNDNCTAAGVCAGIPIVTGCVPADCSDGNSCTNDICTAGVCSHPAVSPICPAANTVACGAPITPTNGCGTCTGVGTMGCLPACTDADSDGYCAEASGACTGTSICTGGYSDCNNANIAEYILYPANTYHLDVDVDGYGRAAFITTTFCSNAAHTGAVASGTDCDDAAFTVNPAAIESATQGTTCADSYDNDCDGAKNCSDTACSTYAGCSAGTAIPACTTTPISVAGNYYLSSSSTYSSGTSNCLTITGDNVKIDGMGKTISVSGSYYGVYLSGSTSNNVSGFELTNTKFNINGYSHGIDINYADNFKFIGNNFTFLSSASGAYGVYTQNRAIGGEIRNNRFTDSTSNGNYGLWFTPYSDRNSITWNTFSGLYYGIYLNSANNYLFDNNATASTSDYYGLLIDGYNGQGNDIERNRACGGHLGDDIRIYYCANNDHEALGNRCSTSSCTGTCQYSCP